MKPILIIIAAIILSSCTAQERAKSWGGEAEIVLPKGQKIVSVTWKETDLWYLIRPAREGEKPEVLTFQEDSNLGLLEGKVTFTEQ